MELGIKMDLKQLKISIEQKRGRFQQLQSDKKETELNISDLEEERNKIEKSRNIINIVAKQTQEQFSLKISDLVSSALESVFDNPYTFHAEFINRRNRTECDLYFIRDGYKRSPMDASGGGVVNVASSALRIGLLMLSRYRKVLILDEPTKDLHSKKLKKRMSNFLKEVTKKAGIQLLVFSGDEDAELISGADKVFMITQEDGISKVEEMET
jgi:DNA repair exonuclease SbcCD ATPase subunit